MNLVLGLTLALQLMAANPKDAPFLLKNGDKAPPFSMRQLNGKMFSLRDYTGSSAKKPKKAVLLSFFATWCEPCKKEIPIIKKLYRRWKSKGVEVVYLGLSQGAKELKPFSKKRKLPWPVIPDSFGLLSRRYGASQLPHLVLVDANSKIVFQHRGIHDELASMLDNQLAKTTGVAVPSESQEELVADAKPRFDKTFIMARPPSGSGASKRWLPVANYVSEKLQANIDMADEDSYESFEKSLKIGKYDIVNASPLLWYKVRSIYQPVVQIERLGTHTYFGIIFAKRDKKIESLENLKGKTIALVSETSTSGGLYPQLALIKAGLIPGKDIKILWTGSHPEVAKAVKEGKADAGGCYEDCREAVWKDTAARAEATNIIAYTEDIPAEAVLVKRSLAKKVKRNLRKAFMRINKEGGILNQISENEKQISAFVAAADKNIAGLSKVIREVENALKSKKTEDQAADKTKEAQTVEPKDNKSSEKQTKKTNDG